MYIRLLYHKMSMVVYITKTSANIKEMLSLALYRFMIEGVSILILMSLSYKLSFKISCTKLLEYTNPSYFFGIEISHGSTLPQVLDKPVKTVSLIGSR